MAKAPAGKLDRAWRRGQSIEQARERRVESSARRLVRVEWFIDQVTRDVRIGSKQRVKLATDLIRNQVVINISRPVRKVVTSRGTITTVSWSRSKKGEYPKADTTLLMKTIFGEMIETRPDVFEGYVGTPLDYGLILETNERLDRSFLLRTFREEYSKVVRILTAPLDGHSVGSVS